MKLEPNLIRVKKVSLWCFSSNLPKLLARNKQRGQGRRMMGNKEQKPCTPGDSSSPGRPTRRSRGRGVALWCFSPTPSARAP